MAIDNLTGTTWYVPSGWEVAAEYGNFEVDLTEITSNNVTTKINSTINFGASIDDDLDYVATSNSIGFWNTDGAFTLINNTQSITFKFGDIGGGLTSPNLISWLTEYGIQLKVDDLTNTTWTVNAGWEAEAGYGEFDVQGTLNVPGHLGDADIPCDGFDVGYNSNGSSQANVIRTVLDDEMLGGNYGCFPEYGEFTLCITSGTDIKNPKLIAWLSKWGELQVEEEGEAPPDNLTGYTWTCTSTECTQSFGIYEVFGVVASNGNSDYPYGTSDIYCTTLYVGYTWDPDNDIVAKSNAVLYMSQIAEISPGYKIDFTRGDDIDDPELIGWLYEHGTFEKTNGEEETPDSPEEPTVTSQGEIYYKGELVATLVEGETVVLHTKDFKFLGDIVIKNVGEVKEEANTVNITLNAGLVVSASGSFSYANIKFGSAPTSDSDYDYDVRGGANVYDKDGTSNTTWSLTVSPIAYVWQDVVDSNGGCKINGSAMTVGTGYANASQITLNDGDIVTLLSTYD